MYRPLRPNKPNVNGPSRDAINKALGISGKGPVWVAGLVANVPQPSSQPSVSPTPTPSVTPTNTVTPTPTLTPTNTVTPTNTITPTPTPSFSFDADALNYINALETTGATLTFTQKTYINDFYVDAKAQGVYSYFGDFYPMLGGTSSTHAINGKSPGTNNLTFFGGWTHNASGATPNGTNSYADMISDNQIYPNERGMVTYYVATSYTGGTGQYIIGAGTTAGGFLNYRNSRAGATQNVFGYGFRNGVDRPTANVSGYTLGWQVSMRTDDSNIEFWAQGNFLATTGATSSGQIGNAITIRLARQGTSSTYGVGRCQFTNIGSWDNSTSSPNISIMNTLIEQLQTDFGRSAI